MSNNKNSKTSCGETSNWLAPYKGKIFGSCLIIVFAILIVFIILPTIFILLGALWPEIFPGSIALQQLTSNLNSLVGYVSMLVGIASIIYSYAANREMTKQSQGQQEFLDDLRSETKQILSTVGQIYTTNQQLSNKFDLVSNLQYRSLNTPEHANEQ